MQPFGLVGLEVVGDAKDGWIADIEACLLMGKTFSNSADSQLGKGWLSYLDGVLPHIYRDCLARG